MPESFLSPRMQKFGRWAAYLVLFLLITNFVLWQTLEWNARSYIALVDKCERDRHCRCGLAMDGSGEVVCLSSSTKS